jgi:hypothetical protein
MQGRAEWGVATVIFDDLVLPADTFAPDSAHRLSCINQAQAIGRSRYSRTRGRLWLTE